VYTILFTDDDFQIQPHTYPNNKTATRTAGEILRIYRTEQKPLLVCEWI